VWLTRLTVAVAAARCFKACAAFPLQEKKRRRPYIPSDSGKRGKTDGEQNEACTKENTFNEEAAPKDEETRDGTQLGEGQDKENNSKEHAAPKDEATQEGTQVEGEDERDGEKEKPECETPEKMRGQAMKEAEGEAKEEEEGVSKEIGDKDTECNPQRLCEHWLGMQCSTNLETDGSVGIERRPHLVNPLGNMKGRACILSLGSASGGRVRRRVSLFDMVCATALFVPGPVFARLLRMAIQHMRRSMQRGRRCRRLPGMMTRTVALQKRQHAAATTVRQL
jgi:hypothetical protein